MLDPPQVLVTQLGLFRYICHPMYLGDGLLLLGLALLVLNIVSIGLMLVGMVALYQLSVVEDHAMQSRFGAQYQTWQQTTKRFVPFVF